MCFEHGFACHATILGAMHSFVVTGGARGVGRAIAERLARDGHVVVLDVGDPDWAHERVAVVTGDASDPAVAERAADVADEAGALAGWVNNAAVFRDAALHDTPAEQLVELIARNLGLAVTGCATAVRRFLAAGTGGAIVNVSSHQAQRPVPGALPYATAKAAIEGLTRAVAVDYGPRGIRANAVALGSIATGRIGPAMERDLRALHPLGRVGAPEEVASVVAHLLGPDASYVNGAVVAIDGGRAVLGQDPEARAVT
jgi:NAD(P)-dependent dehydrogenase (short-subunit alcohol dehydrogenase family)